MTKVLNASFKSKIAFGGIYQENMHQMNKRMELQNKT